MLRITYAFLLFLIAYAVLAAPASKDGWERIDPDHHCKFNIKDGTLTGPGDYSSGLGLPAHLTMRGRVRRRFSSR
jgi:hypothetical protein